MSFEERISAMKKGLQPSYIRTEGREASRGDWWQDGFERGVGLAKQELGWQPIETIEEIEGHKVLLLYSNYDVEQVEWIDFDLEVQAGWKSVVSGDYMEMCHDTDAIAWMNIPEPPKSSSEAEVTSAVTK